MKLRFVIRVGVCALLAASGARAASLTWDADASSAGAQDGGGTWDTISTNWWDGAANIFWNNATPDSAIFGVGGAAGVVSLGEAISVSNITFNAGYTIQSNTITLSSVSALSVLSNATISSTLAGGGARVSGAGALTLSGANTFGGGVLITNGGTVLIGHNSALGAGTLTLAGGSIRPSGSRVISNLVVVTAGTTNFIDDGASADLTLTNNSIAGSGTLTFGNANISSSVWLSSDLSAFSGRFNFIVNSGGLNLRFSGNATNLQNAFVNLSGATTGREIIWHGATNAVVQMGELSGAGGLIGGGQGNGFTLQIGALNTTSTFSGIISTPASGVISLQKVGSGTLVLGGQNTFGGEVIVSGGTLRSLVGNLGGSTALGQNNNVHVLTGATLDVGGVNGTANQIGVTEKNTINVSGGTLKFSLTGASGQDGPYMGTINLNGATVTGATNAGPRFGYSHGNGFINATGTSSTWSAPIWLVNQSGVSLTITTATNLTISGVIADFTGITGLPLIKSGTGALIISGTNTFAGNTTVSAGRLQFITSNAFGTAGTIFLGNAGTTTNATELASGQTAGDVFFQRPVNVTTNGTGTATVGGRHTGGRAFMDGVVTLNRDTTLLAVGVDRTQFRGGIIGTGNVTIAGNNRVTWSTTTGTTEFGNGAANFTFAGNIFITNAGVILQLNSDFISGNQSLAAKNVDVGSGSSLKLPYDADATFNALTGGGTVEGFAPGGGAAGNYLTVGASGGSGTFAGTIINSGGATLHLTKSGTGVQTLTGVNSYSGATTINAGALALAGGGGITVSPLFTIATNAVFDVAAASFTIGSGKTLQGFGSVTGNIAAAAGAKIIPGGTNTLGSLTFNGNLTLAAGTTNYFELPGSTNSSGDLLVVNGNIEPNGSTISLNSFLPLSTGTYTLVTFTGTNSTFFDPALKGVAALSRQSLVLDQTNTVGQVNLVVSGGAAALVWNSAASASWDVQTSTNWFNTAAATNDVFFQNDGVMFDDTPGVTTTVAVVQAVYPASVAINASTNAFTFTGPGAIAGSMSFSKTGTNAVTIATTNSYSGTTRVSNGTLVVASANAFGTSAVVLDGDVRLTQAGGPRAIANSIAAGGPVVTLDDAGSSLTLSGSISGAAALAKRGVGTVTLGASNSYAGGTTISEGALTVGNVATLGIGPVVVLTNSTLTLGTIGVTNAITLAGGTLGIGGGIVCPSPITLAAASNTINSAGNYSLLSGPISGTGDLLITGTGTPGVQFSNTNNSFLGNLTINTNCFLRLTAGEVLPDTAFVNILSNGNIRLEGGGLVETIAGLSGIGQVWVPITADNHTLRIGALDTSSTYAGNIGPVGQHQTVTLVKIGNGTFTLTGTNQYSNATLVQGGTLDLTAGSIYNGAYRTARVTMQSNATIKVNSITYGDGNSFGQLTYNTYETSDVPPSASAPVPATAHLVFDGGTLECDGATQQNGHGFIVTGNGGTLNVTNPATTFTINQRGGIYHDSYLWGTLTLAGAGSGIFQDKIFSGTGGIVKAGSGTWIFANTNSYTGGTIVSGGTLVVNGTLGDATIATGATLGGTGIVGAITSDGAVSPGTSTGVLTAAGYTQNAGGSLNIEVGGISQAGVDYDHLYVSGTANLGGTLNVSIVNGYVPSVGDQIIIMQATTLNGTFAATNLPNIGTNLWTVDYYGGSLVLLSVTNPPPSGPAGYDLWAAQITNGQTNHNDSALGDGYPNLLKYATGSNPTNADNLAQMNRATTNGMFALKFNRNTNATDLTLIIEGSFASTNEATWSGIATNIHGSWGATANYSEDTTTDPAGVVVWDTATATNRFLRLRVTRP